MFKNILTMCVMVLALGFSAIGQAEEPVPVDDLTAASMLTECHSTGDSTVTNSPNASMCCSKSLGYCIACPTSASKGCKKVSHVKGIVNGLTTKPATSGSAMPPKTPSLRDRIKVNKAKLPAAAKAAPAAQVKPTTKLKKSMKAKTSGKAPVSR